MEKISVELSQMELTILRDSVRKVFYENNTYDYYKPREYESSDAYDVMVKLEILLGMK